MTNKPEFIIFDYGNTLVHEDINHGPESFKRVYETITNNPDNLSLNEIHHRFLEIKKDVRENFHKDDLEFKYTDVFKIVFTKFRLDSSHNYEKLSEFYFDDFAKGSLMSGAVETLEYIKKQGIDTGVISNLSWSEDILSKRLKNMLDHDFKYIMTTAQWIYRKPDKRIFDIGVVKSGVDRSKIWYVGDNPKCDIVGAHDAGIVPVYFKSPHENPFLYPHEMVELDMDYISIDKLTDIIEILEES